MEAISVCMMPLRLTDMEGYAMSGHHSSKSLSSNSHCCCATRQKPAKAGTPNNSAHSLQGSESRLQPVGTQNEKCCNLGLRYLTRFGPSLHWAHVWKI